MEKPHHAEAQASESEALPAQSDRPGRGVRRWQGGDLGRWGTKRQPSKEARAAYDRFITEWLNGGRRLPAKEEPSPESLTVSELIVAFRRHVERYYRKPDGTPTSEQHNIRMALRPVRRLYGFTPAVQFGPTALQAVRQWMIDANWSRGFINRSVGRIRRMFRWAAQSDLLSVTVHQALKAVPDLRRGRSDAQETDPVKPVPIAHVHAIQEHVPAPVWAMVQLQSLTGMRPGEVLMMRTCDLDTTGDVWLYRPASHKTEHQAARSRRRQGGQVLHVHGPYQCAGREAHGRTVPD
ncbi:MAG: hypothetical protein HY000_02855 [Planctomycetes bacterium]|nr:hypothetical protein [Planctomycetota bacterium]